MAELRLWNFTLDDASPMFRYLPPSDGLDASAGWQGIYDDKTNVSHHITRTPNASVALSFFGSGTGVALYGSSNASYVVSLDGSKASKPSHQDNILFGSSDAKLAMHNLQLQVHSINATQELWLDKAVVTSSVIGSSKNEQTFKWCKTDENARLLAYKKPSNNFPLNPTSNTTVRATSSPGDSISFSFNGRAIAAYGPVNASSGLFAASHNSDVHVLNASSPIPIEETLLYYEDGFDESNSTTITFTNLGIGQTCFAISRAEVLSFNSTAQNAAVPASSRGLIQKNYHIGAIIGLAIGILIIIISVLCGVLFLKKRKGRNTAGGQITPFESDEGIVSHLTRSSSKILPPEPDVPQARTASQPEVASSSSTIVERLLLLIARQVDSVERIEVVPEEQDRSLPPYPSSTHNRSFRSTMRN